MTQSNELQPNTPLTTSYSYQPRGDGTFIAKPNRPEQWVWVSVAARIHGVSQSTIKRWITKKFVNGKRVGLKKWKVDLVSVEALIARTNQGAA